ncbi:hypothetical protein CBG25_03150 [Arsenophonus sp. ENCA]|uniref:hypothetical protein n=1 Tax=Arsenophonus sp. ENCA TaxID=1987579 RepID=UPI000BDC8765|nr:hypothetical protein [Arsenophonus sp. ENCA]PAV09240.1 hypothetical protein CBG25_03150 [Arsenophonus sp. ENCA]
MIKIYLKKKLKGDSHRTAVFGAGLGLGYDFYEKFDIPIRTELEFISRSNTNYNYSGDSVVIIFNDTIPVKNQIAVIH